MADNENSPKSGGLANILASITSNPELMETISGIVGGAPSDTAEKDIENRKNK